MLAEQLKHGCPRTTTLYEIPVEGHLHPLSVKPERHTNLYHSSISLSHVPTELLAWIWVYAGSNELSRVNTCFWSLSRIIPLRFQWLLHRHGPEGVLARIWKYRIMLHPSQGLSSIREIAITVVKNCDSTSSSEPPSYVPHRNELISENLHSLSANASAVTLVDSEMHVPNRPCRCRKKYDPTCALEETQVQLISTLIHDYGANIDAGNGYSLQKAVMWRHYRLIEFLIHHGASPEAQRPVKYRWIRYTESDIVQQIASKQKSNTSSCTSRLNLPDILPRANVPPRSSSLHRQSTPSVEMPTSPSPISRSSLLYTSIAKKQYGLAKLLIDSPLLLDEQQLSSLLTFAITGLHSSIAQHLILSRHVRVSSKMIRDLLTTASSKRIILGIRRRYCEMIQLLITHVSPEIFERYRGMMLRTVAEIGDVEGFAILQRRAPDVLNSEDGLALYVSMYNANVSLMKHLLEQGADVSLVSWHKRACSILLAMVELIAILMFVALTAFWLSALLSVLYPSSTSLASSSSSATGGGTSSGSDGNSDSLSAGVVNAWELTGLLVPSAFALVYMLYLVPLHRLVYAMFLLCSYDGRRVNAIPERLPV